MTTEDFADRFERTYRRIYSFGVRRIPDKRHRLSPETIAILQHLAISGPVSMGELGRHLSRAPSTVSEMTRHLAGENLLEQDRDVHDRRKTLVWLTRKGQDALETSQKVLDPRAIEQAAGRMNAQQRSDLLALLEVFANRLQENKR